MRTSTGDSNLRAGVSTFVATLILVSISLSLSYVVYEGVSRMATPGPQQVFANQVSEVGGSPALVEVTVNSSAPGTPVAFEAGAASSSSGVLYFDGTRYGTTTHLCVANATTFFSVHTGNGVIRAQSSGRTWIDGYWTEALTVGAGWHEVMFSDASSCSVTDTDGGVASYPGADVSTVPMIGRTPSSTFVLYLPGAASPQPFVMVFDGSYDTIA